MLANASFTSVMVRGTVRETARSITEAAGGETLGCAMRVDVEEKNA